MDRLRLDPADPLASVIAWLAALARALGIDPSAPMTKPQLCHAAATIVRDWLADVRRQLNALVCAEAVRLARSLAAGSRLGRGLLPRHRPLRGRRSPIVRARIRAPGGRGSCPRSGLRGDLRDGPPPASLRSVTSPACGGGSVGAPPADGATPDAKSAGSATPPRLGMPHARCPLSTRETTPAAKGRARPAWDAWISDAEDAALRRRQLALLDGLRDRSALVRRLALRLARRRARATAALAALRGRLRFPHPPRALGALRALATAPEPRPPDPALSAPV